RGGDSGGEGAGRGEPLALKERVEHLPALRHVVHSHLDKLLVAVGNEREVHVPEEGAELDVVVVLVAVVDYQLQDLEEVVAHVGRNEVGHRPPHHHHVLLAGQQEVHSLGGGIGGQHLPRSPLDLINGVRGVVYRVAGCFLCLRRTILTRST